MAPEGTNPPSDVNVPGDYFSLAGFEVTTYGRFWVSPEGKAWPVRAKLLKGLVGPRGDLNPRPLPCHLTPADKNAKLSPNKLL